MAAHRPVLADAGVAATVCATVVATCAVIVTVTITGPHGVPVLVETRPTFDKTDVQSGVMDALRAKGIGVGGVASLSCPAGMPMAAGTSFDRTFEEGVGTSADRKETVLVTVTDDAGRYDVSLRN
jgi:hypothetical protein